MLLKTERRSLLLRPYQIPASDFVLENDISVLAMCPNGGKTEISIDVISRYLNLNPNNKILILTHSTNVLKANYVDRLEGLFLDFKYSTTFCQDCNVHICLPSSEHLINDAYDFLIIDEAHENYLEKRVQRIIKNIKPSKQLLLTGSPSKFIKKGNYKIFTVAINELPEEYFAKLNVELVASNYKWSNNYNNDLEVKSSFDFKKEDTKNALESIILKLIDRVSKKLSPEEFNNPNIFTKLKSWAYTYKRLGKTMIVCRSIKQARQINEVLIHNGVNSVASDHESDKDSILIADFKENKYDVLVVVDRARLGYSDNNLFNIIDMSGTHNPDIIYQMFSRTLRGDSDMQKYYLKVTTQEYGMMDFTHACVCAALMLTDHKYLSTFNGDNFNGIRIPVLKNNIKKELSNGDGGKKIGKSFIFPEFTNDVIDMFRNIIHNLDNPISIYKLTTLKHVKANLSGRRVWVDEEIWDSARGNI